MAEEIDEIARSAMRTMVEVTLPATINHEEGTCFHCDQRRLMLACYKEVLEETDPGRIRNNLVFEAALRITERAPDLYNRLYGKEGRK